MGDAASRMHVVATAGHVDHGKSTLVRALTGMEPDRWAEERRRGMTIDLGYAWCTLTDGEQVAFVDVPGHERFVTNMLAGVGPIPSVLLVIAADDGWSRQTQEHVDALDALDVRHGLLAVTRSDLADPTVAVADAGKRLTATSLRGIEAVPVSGRTGAGLDELRAALARLVATVPPPRPTAARLWIDRVFTIRGAGTVVTGTLTAGSVAVGDELAVSGRNDVVHVRGLETLGEPVREAHAVARVALNLRGVKPDALRRGDALLAPGRFADVQELDVRVASVAELPASATLHVGSAAVPARVRPFDDRSARLTLARPLPLQVGERALLRDAGSHRIAGVVVLDVSPPALRRRGDGARRAALLRALPDRPSAGAEVVRLGLVRRDHLISSGILEPDGTVDDVVELAGWLVAPGRWTSWQQELRTLTTQRRTTHPLTPAVPRDVVAQQLGVPAAELVAPLVAAAGLVLDDAGVHETDAAPSLPVGVARALADVTTQLADNPFAAPEIPELRAAGLADRELAAIVRLGALMRVAPGVYLLPDAADRAAILLAGLPQPFTLSAARAALSTTRRVAVPLLELLDARGLTTRVDDQLRAVVVPRQNGE